MSAGRDSGGQTSERLRHREARAVIGAYHEEQLRALLERVRTGVAQLDAGEIDPFELGDLIHHYKRSARELWKLCGSSGSEWERAARTLAFLRDSGEEPDWWQLARPALGADAPRPARARQAAVSAVPPRAMR